MGTITYIPPKPKNPSGVKPEETHKKRVAAYCRVSTDSDEQEASYEIQVEHYTEYIGRHPGWELAGIYADEGISGTNTKKREEFNRMIEDCMAGKIDMVVTKSISRFARNTLDCLSYIKQLKDKNIPVYFEKENIDSMDSKGDIMLTIMASLAQDESRSISQNVRMGIQYRYQQGKVRVCTNRFLGYDKDENGKLVINPEEAEVVKRIFREFLEGKSYYAIGQGLTADGIKTAAGNSYWLSSTLRKILMNEKYMGDALLQKTITVDFLTKKRVVNNGLVPQYYVTESHEAIIPRRLFLLVQEEIVRRSKIDTGTGRRRVYSGKYALSSMVYCAHCGDIYKRTQWLKKGEHIPVWRCASRLQKKKSGIDCPSRTIFEEDLHAAVLKAVNKLIIRAGTILPEYRANVEKVLEETNNEEIMRIDAEMLELQKEILKKANARQDYGDTEKRIDELRDEKQKLLLDDATRENVRKQTEAIEEFVREQKVEVAEYDEALVSKLLDKITVYDDKMIFKFKSGLEMEVE